jgi:pantetheine-phosphate adenylyltransferase
MKKIIAVYPGTFDPVTNGHLDIIKRASQLFDKVIVTIAVNTSKSTLFTKEERKEMLSRTIPENKNVEVDVFNGLVVDYAIQKKATVLIRGLRAISDFEYEFQMSLTNQKMQPSVTTIFLMPNEKYTYLNSSLIREIARLKGDVKCFVPPFVKKKLLEKFGNKKP